MKRETSLTKPKAPLRISEEQNKKCLELLQRICMKFRIPTLPRPQFINRKEYGSFVWHRHLVGRLKTAAFLCDSDVKLYSKGKMFLLIDNEWVLVNKDLANKAMYILCLVCGVKPDTLLGDPTFIPGIYIDFEIFYSHRY